MRNTLHQIDKDQMMEKNMSGEKEIKKICVKVITNINDPCGCNNILCKKIHIISDENKMIFQKIYEKCNINNVHWQTFEEFKLWLDLRDANRQFVVHNSMYELSKFPSCINLASNYKNLFEYQNLIISNSKYKKTNILNDDYKINELNLLNNKLSNDKINNNVNKQSLNKVNEKVNDNKQMQNNNIKKYNIKNDNKDDENSHENNDNKEDDNTDKDVDINSDSGIANYEKFERDEKNKIIIKCDKYFENQKNDIMKWMRKAQYIYENNTIIYQRPIGAGAYGDVSLIMVEDDNNKKYKFAKKVKNNKKTHDTIEYEGNIRKEIGDKVIPGIVTYLKSNKNEIIMRYYTDTLFSLSTKLDKNLRIKLAPYILFQLSYGLYKINKVDLFHNDIKPKNILINYSVDENNNIEKETIEAVLGDLGGVTLRGKRSVYSALYKAPDKKNSNLSSRADIYSLGLSIIYFINGGDHEIKKFRNRYDYNSLDIDYTNSLYNILKKMVSKHYNERPRTEDILNFLYPLII